MRRRMFLAAIVGLALVACNPTTTPSAKPSINPTANQTTNATANQTANTTTTALANPTIKPTAQAAAALFTCASRTQAWDGKSAIDLTGTWAGDDQGVYYLRQLGDQIWWLGMSGLGQPLVDRGTDWTN